MKTELIHEMLKKEKFKREVIVSYGGMNRAGTRDMDTSVIWAEHSPYTYEALDLILTTEKEEI